MSAQQNNLLFGIIIIALIVGAYYYSQQTTMQTPQGISDAQLAAYLKNITTANTGISTIKALSSGTGDKSLLMTCFPQAELTGWDSEAKAADPTQPNNADGSVNWIYQEDYSFFADFTSDSGFIVTDSNGAKQIPFAKQDVGGGKTYYFKSFKVNPGTLLMITAWSKGLAPQTGFVLQGRDCRNVEKMLIDYPELTGGNNGIFWEGRPQWEIHWSVTALNKDFFHIEMLKKFNTCMDLANGIGNSVGNQDDPNTKLGLHFADGTVINSTIPNQPQMGRWYYDKNCNPIIDPRTGKQAYKRGAGGWGQSCEQSHEYCKLDPGLLVGVKLSQFDIEDNGVPNFVGIEDVDGGISVNPSTLSLDAVGWTPSITSPAPADASSLLSTPASVTVSSFANRLSQKSDTLEHQDVNNSHHSGFHELPNHLLKFSSL